MATALGTIASHRTATASIPLTGLAGWWDADATSTFSYSSGTVVSQWRDKSGANRHFAQNTVAWQPNRNATQNGRSGVTFAGAHFIDHDAGSDTLTTSPWTLSVALKFKTRTTSDGRILTTRRSAAGAADYQAPNAILLWRNGATDNVSAMSAGTASTVQTGGTAAMIAGSRMTGTQIYASVNGVETAPVAAPASSNVRYLRLGAYADSVTTPPGATANHIDAEIYEVVLYQRDLSTPERQQVETYLRTKWGTP